MSFFRARHSLNNISIAHASLEIGLLNLNASTLPEAYTSLQGGLTLVSLGKDQLSRESTERLVTRMSRQNEL